jgi:hypothetical protein
MKSLEDIQISVRGSMEICGQYSLVSLRQSGNGQRVYLRIHMLPELDPVAIQIIQVGEFPYPLAVI